MQRHTTSEKAVAVAATLLSITQACGMAMHLPAPQRTQKAHPTRKNCGRQRNALPGMRSCLWPCHAHSSGYRRRNSMWPLQKRLAGHMHLTTMQGGIINTAAGRTSIPRWRATSNTTQCQAARERARTVEPTGAQCEKGFHCTPYWHIYAHITT